MIHLHRWHVSIVSHSVWFGLRLQEKKLRKKFDKKNKKFDRRRAKDAAIAEKELKADMAEGEAEIKNEQKQRIQVHKLTTHIASQSFGYYSCHFLK